MLANEIKKRDLNAVFCLYILLILVTIIKKKNQCCTFKFNLKIKQNIKHYYSTVSLKFCFNDEKLITPVKGLNPGVFFWRRLLLKLTTCTYDKNVYCLLNHLLSYIFHAVYNKLVPQYNYAHSFDSVLLLSIQDNTPTCNWTLFFPILTNSTKNYLT